MNIYKYNIKDATISNKTKDFIQKGKKIILFILIIFQEIINPPLTDIGAKKNIPKIIKLAFSLILYKDSVFIKFNEIKKFNRQEYITVKLVPKINIKNKRIFLPFIITISIIKSFE